MTVIEQDGTSSETTAPLAEVIACSLKGWDEVWNRNNFFAEALLRRNPELRILFVEPPADPLYDLSQRRVPRPPWIQSGSTHSRLRVIRPLKPGPRRLGRWVDACLCAQVRLGARWMGFMAPVLWVNDITYAPLILETNWSSVYDVSDDWLLAPFAEREIERLTRLDSIALQHSDEVVVCSPTLVESRGVSRKVSLIRNAVDVEHFRRPQTRPADLPRSPVAVYAGTAHDARIDVSLVADLARDLPHVRFVFVGPNALGRHSRHLLGAAPNIVFLGPRPYEDLPGYLQHADVVFVPHLVSPFMESLDPIKAYECLAVRTPTVATPVPGFRQYPESIHVADRSTFERKLVDVLEHRADVRTRIEPASWEDRAIAFEAVLRRAVVAPG